MTATALNAAALESAFDAFNERSVLLETSYRELQHKVEFLTAKLQATQSARHNELLEKERLGERLGRLLEALPGAVIVLDADGIICECNDGAAGLLGMPLVGRSWAEIVQREFTPGGNADGDLHLHDGRVLSMQRKRFGNGDGEILLLTDVSDSRRMADLLSRHQRLSAIGEMTARLAHQVRTPLASALLYASQLTPGKASGDSPAGRIVSRLREMDRMVNDMLQFAGGARADGESLDVPALLADVAETSRARCSGDICIDVMTAPGAQAVTGNYGALKGALCNLVDNAAAACGGNGRIEIGAHANDGHINLTVSDNGHGIDAETLARVFEPFYTTRPQGTGLGLAVVHSVAEAHAGDVLVQSDPAGTTVAMRLPLCAVTATSASREACHV